MSEIQILGSAEAADLAGVERGHFHVMRKRGQVPQPQVMLACGPIWKRSVIEKWIADTNARKKAA
jgi:predicted DNA-binding transcriptional regulator AlpA